MPAYDLQLQFNGGLDNRHQQPGWPAMHRKNVKSSANFCEPHIPYI